jgi:glucose/mannose-6-phosphate isomerase
MLDSLRAIAGGDPKGMLAAVEAWPEQWRWSVDRCAAITPGMLPATGGVENVVLCGMGGSGLGGDAVRALAAPVATVPLVVVRSYDLPAFVSERSFVICVSYSGETEETISCFDTARARGARLAVVAGDGALRERARAAGALCVEPQPGLQPRAALPSLLVPLLVMLDRAGILPHLRGDLDPALGLIEARVAASRRESRLERNEAKRLASTLHGTAPVVWGTDGALAVAATRWKTQLNENAKLPAWASALPELDHNEVVGYEPGHPSLAQTSVVVLGEEAPDGRMESRVEATIDLVAPKVARVERVVALGRSPLQRLCDAMVLGDFVSIYLALLRGVDPTPIEAIRRIKEATA